LGDRKKLDVKVLYFALARELTRKERETIHLRGGATLTEFKKELMGRHPQLERLGDSVRYSLNLHVVVSTDIPLHDGDEVGVLPAVAGG
jgi:molybdopterin converting factor small subunit